MTDKVKRKINFFKIFMEDCNFEEIYKILCKLKKDELYYKTEDKWYFLGNIKNTDSKYSGVIRSIKFKDFPSIGRINRLDVESLNLEKDEGLSESTHFIVYPKAGHIVIENNFYGPSWSVLETYINEKIFKIDEEKQMRIEFRMIINRDYKTKLERIGSVYSVEMEFPIARVNDLKTIDKNLFESLQKCHAFGEVDNVEIVLKSKKWSRNPILENSFGLRKILEVFLKDDKKREVFDKFKMKAFDKENQRKVGFDLLEDKLIVEIQTVKLNRNRSVDSKDILQKLESAYNSKRELLKEYDD